MVFRFQKIVTIVHEGCKSSKRYMKVAINTTSAPMQKFAVRVNPKKNTEMMDAQMRDTANDYMI
jgi:hypothetical protein